MFRRRRALLAGLAGALMALAACSGSDGGTASATGSSTSSAEREMLDYIECMRDQGVEIDDPIVEPDGTVSMPPIQIRREGGARLMSEVREVCGQPPGGALGGSGGDPTAMQDSALAYAQCMRDNGVDMPDPDFSGGAVMFRGGSLDETDPAFQAAQEECRDIIGEVVGGPGGGGMRAGSGG